MIAQHAQLVREDGALRLGLVRGGGDAGQTLLLLGGDGLRFGQALLRVGEATGDNPRLARDSGVPHDGPRNADGEPDGQPDDDADDHESQGNERVYQGRGWSSTWSRRVLARQTRVPIA